MPNAARLNLTIENAIQGVATPLGGVVFVEGITKRGPISDPSTIITSWPQFIRIHGGESSSTDFPTLCKRLFNRGSSLRVNRVTHYDTGITTADKAPAIDILMSTDALFSLQPKYHGADYNNLRYVISAASNGDANYFNLQITHVVESDLNESYPNLFISGKPTADASTYLDIVKKQSSLVDVVYKDLSGIAGTQLRPTNATYTVVGGSDGDAVVAADYVGASSSKNGFYAFDDYTEAYFLAAPEISDATVHTSGASYAVNRGDIVYAAHLDNTNNTAALLSTARAAVTADTPLVAFYAGGTKILDNDSNIKEISELADVLAAHVVSAKQYGVWYSFAGSKRGQLTDVLGVVNNFGSPARFADLNLIANNQINMVVMKNGIPQISGNFTAQKAYNQQSQLSVQLLILYIRKALGPVVESYLEDPADIITFRTMYYHVKPFLDDLASPERRALWGYSWLGDQDARSLDDLKINRKEDVLLGKYKVKLKLTPIASMQEITLAIILTAEGVTFTQV